MTACLQALGTRPVPGTTWQAEQCLAGGQCLRHLCQLPEGKQVGPPMLVACKPIHQPTFKRREIQDVACVCCVMVPASAVLQAVQAAGGVKVLARLCEQELQTAEVLKVGTAAIAGLAVERAAKVGLGALICGGSLTHVAAIRLH